MAAVVTELNDGSRASDGNVSGNRCVRRWKVTDSTNPIVRENVMLTPGLPVAGSQFYVHDFSGLSTRGPLIPLSAVAYRVIPTESPYMVYVEVEYDDTQFEYSEEQNIQRKPEEYPVYMSEPYFSQVVAAIGNPPTGTYIVQPKWVIRILQYESFNVQLTVTGKAPLWTNIESSKVRTQVGFIHRFNGAYWQYQGATSIREGPTRWSVTHKWVGDPGFPGDEVAANPPLGLDFPDIILPKAYTTQADGVVTTRSERRPFETYLAVPSKYKGVNPLNQLPIFDPPKVAIIAPLRVKEDGWRDLPWVPLFVQ